MRPVLVLSLALLPAVGFAQDAPTRQPFSPLSGPNTAIPSPVCDLINFGFCPQPPGPPPLLPDPEAAASSPPAPTAHVPVHHRRQHRRHVQSG